MDPVSLSLLAGAAGGVSTVIAERAADYLQQTLKGENREVQLAAAENARLMLDALGPRLQRLSDEDVIAALRKPDVAAALRDAVLGASRTENENKHQVLADVVAERIRADDESTHALACNLAIEAVPLLAPRHLQYLAVMALVYAVRPLGLPLRDNAELRSSGQATEDEQKALDEYVPWLRAVFAKIGTVARLGGAEEAHLISTGCVVREAYIRRDLRKTLLPFGERVLVLAVTGGIQMKLKDFLWNEGIPISKAWEFQMEHLTLTPAGLLIGGLYLQEQAELSAADFSVTDLVHPPKAPVAEDIWDGRRIRNEFMNALEQKVQREAALGNSPWYDFSKKR